MAHATPPNSITSALDLVLNAVTTFLVPTAEAHFASRDFTQLQVLVRNIEEIRARVAEAEAGMPEADALSGTLRDLAEKYAAHPNGLTLGRRDLVEHVALFNELEAIAWSMELAARFGAGQPLPVDLRTLRLANILYRQGVRTAAELGDAA